MSARSWRNILREFGVRNYEFGIDWGKENKELFRFLTEERQIWPCS
jgi:hypothetical protein